MATKAEIVAAITSKCSLDYSIWRIGITHDLTGHKSYWRVTKKESVSYWEYWTAASLSDAQDIEWNFINKGMRCGVSENLCARSTVYVYVF
jgi:hypothetical protein